MDSKIIPLNTSDLQLDWKNPRLAEFGIKNTTPFQEIFNILWENMALEEIVISLVAHGFFKTEPLIVLKEDGKYTVIEGNRRLAAVKIVLDTSLVENKLDSNILERITPKVLSDLRKLPAIIVNSREDAWRFVGFKHINGPAKWNSFAKAQYIVQVHEEFGISLDEIAFQVGDTHNTVQKLFQGMMVIVQAEKEKIFNREDVKRGRLYFSHLYTALQYQGFRDFIKIGDVTLEAKEPVPREGIDGLKELLIWLYGSKKLEIEPVVKTQNPDLRRLESVIKTREAISALRDGANLEFAYELSKPKSTVFEDSLFAAKRDLNKAWSYVNEGYNGDKELLKTAYSIYAQAEQLYLKMADINKDFFPGQIVKRPIE